MPISLEFLCFFSADNGDDHTEVDDHGDGTVLGGGSAGRKAFTSGMKEMAVLREKVTDQQRQMGKGGKHQPGPEDSKKLRPPSARVRGGRVWLEVGGWKDRRRESCSGGGHPDKMHVKAKHFPVLPLTYSVTWRPKRR